MTNLDSVLKSRDITLPTKVPYGQSYGFSRSHVQMWELLHKGFEHQRTDAFKSWYWRKVLRVPWTARRSNQSILKEISSEYSLKGLMLKLKLQYFDHLMQRIDSLENTSMLGNTEDGRREGISKDEMVGWHHQLNEHEYGQTPGDGEGQGNLWYCSL